ncbi:MAG: AIR synthase family protein [Candidatus Brocadiae bacterium]|nr:AIR synthase family protein [Candidatus Brocadiia bacterium]
MRFDPGKLDPQLLAELLASNVIKDERVVIRPAVGRDVCAISMGETYLVAKTDPITFATDRIGQYVVHVNANDIATVGARPRWFLLTALLPEKRTDEALVRRIWEEVRSTLDSIGCELCGGHTEVTVGLDRPILVGQMLGEVDADKLVDKANVAPGDRILLTKGVPIEGTAIMALECADDLRAAFPDETIRRARAFLDKPGISVLPEAVAACRAGRVHAMHDPTEGGVATGVWELAEAAGCGVLVREDLIPIVEPGGAFCRHFGLNPLGTISSGSLLICAPPADAAEIQAAVEALGVVCADIGEVRPRAEGAMIVRDGKTVPIPIFPQDEIARLLA